MPSIDEDQFDRQKRVSGWRQDAVEKARVLVVGAGALGNEVVKNLAQLGVRNLTVVDFDEIVLANLNRCVFFTESDVGAFKADVIAREVKKINHALEVSVEKKRLEELPESFFSSFDYAFGCLDNQSTRLHLNAQCYGRMPLLDGGTTGFYGKMQVVRSPSSCLECSLSKRDYALQWKKYSCVGEVIDFLDPKMPALSTTTSVIAAMQVNEFVKLAHGMPALEGKYAYYDGTKTTLSVFEVAKRKNCPVHEAFV